MRRQLAKGLGFAASVTRVYEASACVCSFLPDPSTQVAGQVVLREALDVNHQPLTLNLKP